MSLALEDSDTISRCIIFDRAFDAYVHTDELLWRFEQPEKDGSYKESGVLRRVAPTSAEVHAIGCGIAEKANKRKKEPEPGPKRRYYCGFRSAPYSKLPREGDGYKVEYANDHAWHVDITVRISVVGRNKIANKRTEVGIELAECFGPPESHRCECDLDDDQHPFSKAGTDECLVSGLRDRWPDLTLEAGNDVAQPLSADAEPPAA